MKKGGSNVSNSLYSNDSIGQSGGGGESSNNSVDIVEKSTKKSDGGNGVIDFTKGNFLIKKTG